MQHKHARNVMEMELKTPAPLLAHCTCTSAGPAINNELPVSATCHGNCHTSSPIENKRSFNEDDLSRSLEADQESLERATRYVIAKNGFTLDRAERAKKDFLKYMKDVHIIDFTLHPSEDADAFWHAHLLHTKIYMAWCDRHFGHFVHHVPSGQHCGACSHQCGTQH